MPRPEVLLVMSGPTVDRLFDQEMTARLDELARTGRPRFVTELESAGARARLATAEVLLTGWGVPALTADVLAAAPHLRAVLHAAGSVKGHVTPECWERGLLVSSAAAANAVPVAEFTLAAILSAGKRTAEFAAQCRAHPGTFQPWRDAMPEASNFRRTIGVVGLSRIGRRVVELLRPFDLGVLVADPFADPAEVTALGAEPVELDELVRRCHVVSLHAPSLPQTRHLLNADRLAAMADHATIVNTARGALIDTDALTAECVSGRLHAYLDVTDPEPLPADSPLYTLPNVQLTPHIAGAMDGEVRRLAAMALDELARYAAGEPLRHPVRAEDLARIA